MLFLARASKWLKFGRAMSGPLWIDLPDADSRVAALSASPLVKTAIRDLMHKGVALLRANIGDQLIDEVVADFERHCRSNTRSSEYRDSYGLHERLCNLQMVSAPMRRLALNRQVMIILETIFNARPLVVGSLFFEKGSQQSIHRDGPAFFTNPINHFFGVWNALEDITPESGPLVYYEGGHRCISDEELRAACLRDQDAYFSSIIAACEKQGLPKRSILLNRGDTLIWHPQLPHGGSKIENPAKSRRSAVFHYIPVGVPIYGPNEFFNVHAELDTLANYEVVRAEGGAFYKHAAPKFFHNYTAGNFKEV